MQSFKAAADNPSISVDSRRCQLGGELTKLLKNLIRSTENELRVVPKLSNFPLTGRVPYRFMHLLQARFGV
jgi:hypothetical protein